MKTLKTLYSGKLSNDFWLRVRRLKNNERFREVYSLGCALQDLEGRVLLALDNAERAARQDQEP